MKVLPGPEGIQPQGRRVLDFPKFIYVQQYGIYDLIIWFLLFELKGPINMFYTLLSAQAFETDMSPHQVLDLN